MNNHSKLNKIILKRIIKDMLLLLLALTVCAFAIYKNGLNDTLYKLLTLIFYGVVGFVGFYLIYFILITISKISTAVNLKRRKKLLNTVKNLDFATEKFEYDYKVSLEENFKRYLNFIKLQLDAVSASCGFRGKFLYLNFTFMDALDFASNTLSIVENKIDNILDLPVIKMFDLHNKPITVLEKTLNYLIGNEDENHINKGLKSKIIGKTITVGIKFLFKEKIDEELNKVVNYIGAESCLIYTKNNKKLLKKLVKSSAKNSEGAMTI